MRCDGREHKKVVELYFHWAPSKNKNKTLLNGYSDFEQSLFWSNSKSTRSNNDDKNDDNDNSK